MIISGVFQFYLSGKVGSTKWIHWKNWSCGEFNFDLHKDVARIEIKQNFVRIKINVRITLLL